MGSVWIREFTGGLDARKLPETLPGGTLIRANDCHINRGGQIEKRPAFVKFADLPAGVTAGLAATSTGLVTFGSGTAPTMPTGVAYQQLANPSGTAVLKSVPSWGLFGGSVYAVAVFADASSYHFYNGTRVTDSPGGTFVRTVKTQMYTTNGAVAYFSKLQDPTVWSTTGVGAGFIDMSQQDVGSEKLAAIGKYQRSIAWFSDRTIQIWYMDPAPANNQQLQVLGNTGTISPRSVTQFGDADLFYLDSSGLRSLRARDASNAAATTDIGSPIDPLLIARIQTLSAADLQSVIGLIEPSEGRFWLIMRDQIYVFSYFTGAKVSAWSIYRPGFTIDYAVVYNRKVYLRSGDTVYVFGGPGTVPQYDQTQAEVWLPFLDAGAPSEPKKLTGVDVSCRGTWQLSMAMQPGDLSPVDKIATVTETTFNGPDIDSLGETTHFGLRFLSQDTGPATIGSAVVHYQGEQRGEQK